MRSQITLILSALVLSFGLQSFAQTESSLGSPKNRLEAIYANMVETVNSSFNLEEKLKRIKNLESEYLKISYKMMDDSKTQPEILDRADYLESWELYLKIVPLMQVKLTADKTKADRISCLEASSLVRPTAKQNSNSSQNEEKGLGGFGVEDDLTSELLTKLCK